LTKISFWTVPHVDCLTADSCGDMAIAARQHLSNRLGLWTEPDQSTETLNSAERPMRLLSGPRQWRFDFLSGVTFNADPRQ
jgi:hypothetical protein